MSKCLTIDCLRETITNDLWCLTHLIKYQVHNNLILCSFCCQYRIPIGKNFYIRNRYKAKFWNKDYSPTIFICFDCLYDGQKIEIPISKKGIYRTYKWRYYQQYRKSLSK